MKNISYKKERWQFNNYSSRTYTPSTFFINKNNLIVRLINPSEPG